MRALLLAIMIVLLPLRGWLGDAMAMSNWSSPTHNSPPACVHHTQAPLVAASVSASAENTRLLAAQTSVSESSDHHDGTPDHVMCDVCVAAVMQPLGVAIAEGMPPQATHPLSSVAFVSAWACAALRPPNPA